MAKESDSNANVPLTKQAAGAVTGAVAGSIVGPVGAIVGGVVGAVMGNRVEQGKSAVPTEAVEAAKSAVKQVSRIPVGRSVRSLTAKPGVSKKTSKGSPAKKTSAKKTSAKKTSAKKGSAKNTNSRKTAARKPAAKKSASRPAAKSAKKSGRRK